MGGRSLINRDLGSIAVAFAIAILRLLRNLRTIVRI